MQIRQRDKIAFIVPIFNEQHNILPFYRNFLSESEGYDDSDLVVVFVDDGSHDSSAELVETLVRQSENVMLIQLSKNYGKDCALTAGVDVVEADAYVFVDVDLQHPLDVAFKLVSIWIEERIDQIVAVDTAFGGRSLVRQSLSKIRLWVAKITGAHRPLSGVSDFRLLSRDLAIELRKCRQHSRFLRVILDELHPDSRIIEYKTGTRHLGKAKFNIHALFPLAITEFVLTDRRVLISIFLIGMVSCVSSLALSLIAVIDGMFFRFLLVGTASYFILLILFFLGVVVSQTALTLIVLNHIYKEVVEFPIYKIVKVVGLEDEVG